MKSFNNFLNENNAEVTDYNNFCNSFDLVVQDNSINEFNNLMSSTIWQLIGDGSFNKDQSHSYRIISKNTNKIIGKVTIDKY